MLVDANLITTPFAVAAEGARLSVKSASPAWVDANFVAGAFDAQHLLDGSASRNMYDGTCYHTINVDQREPGAETPSVVFTIDNPMKLSHVDVLTRELAGYSRDPVFGIISLQVFGCVTITECNECVMKDADSLNDATDWVLFSCGEILANYVLLTNEPSNYVIACELRAFGYPTLPKLSTLIHVISSPCFRSQVSLNMALPDSALPMK